MISNLDIYEHSPIPKNWADWDDMMDDNEPLLPDNEKIIKNKKKSSFPDGSSIEVVEYDLIEYFLDKYGILLKKTTRKKDIKKIFRNKKSVTARKENRIQFGDANDPKNDTLTQNLGHIDFEDPNKEVDENETMKIVTSGFSKVMQNLAKRKLENTSEPEHKIEIPKKNTYVPPHLRNKEIVTSDEKEVEEEKSKSVKVDNFPYGTTEEDLHLLFSACGKIRNRNGVFIHPSGNFAFINYESHQEALKAVEMVNNHIYGSLYLNVELAKPRVKKEETNKKTGYGEKLAQQGRYSFVTNSNKKY